MMLFLYGNEPFRMQQRVHTLRKGFQEKYDPHGHQMTDMDTATWNVDEFRKLTKSAGLFATKRFVHLRLSWSMKKEEVAEFLAECAGLPEDTILCVTAPKPTRTTHPLFQRLQKSDRVEVYDVLNPTQVQSFIRAQVQNYGCAIDVDAAHLLAQRVGNDLWQLHFEIKKLCHLSARISVPDVAQFLVDPLDNNIFHLTDALSARSCGRALQLLEDQRRAGAAPQYLISMLGRHVGILYKVKVTQGKGLALHPYVRDQAMRQVKNFSLEKLHATLWELLQLDHYIKTHRTDVFARLSIFVMRMCVGASPR